MAFCENCGAELTDTANYCSQCGKPVRPAGTGRKPDGWLFAAGAVAGSLSALITGYVLSVVVLKVVLAVVGHEAANPQVLAILDRLVPRLAGLEYTSAHHVTFTGFGREGVYLSVLLPVRTWTLIPAAAILFGGWLSAAIARPSGKRDIFAASLVSAAVYVSLLLYLRPLFAVDASVFNLLEFGGTRPDFPPVVLAGSMWGIVLDAGLFSLLLFFLGNLWAGRPPTWSSVRSFLAGRGFLPSWAAGAVSAFLIGQVALVVLLLVGAFLLAVKGRAAGSLGPVFLLAPTIAGAAYYFFHGIAVTAGFGVRVVTVSLLGGTRQMAKLPGRPWIVLSSRPTPAYFWLGLLIPAAALTIGAYIAYPNRDRNESPVVFSLKMAAAYTVLLLVLISFYSLRMNWGAFAPGFGGLNRLSAVIAPSVWQTAVSGFTAGFVFALVGSMLSRARPE